MPPTLISVCPHDTSRMVERWERLVGYLANRSGLGGRFRAYPNFREFRASLEEGRFLWSYLNPADFLTARHRFGYRAIASPRGRPDVALVLHRGPQSSLADLEGQRMAAVPGYLCEVVRHRLKEEGISMVKVAAQSYNEVMTLLENGEADFGVTYNEHFEQLAPAIRESYTAALTVDCSLSHVVAVHPEVAEDRAQALVDELVGAASTPDGTEILAALRIPSFEPFDATPFDRLAQLLGIA